MIQPNPIFRGIPPYVPGEQPQDGRAVKLNTNEFPYPAAPEVVRAIQEAAGDAVRLYPSPRCDALRDKLAAYHGVGIENIFVGNGSDEVLRLIIQLYSTPGRMTAAVWPTYSLFPNLVAMTGAKLHEFPLVEMEKIPESLFGAGWDLLLLPYPNPPLGTLFNDGAIERLANCEGVLVLDEAYIDFAEADDKVELMKKRESVIITRTFSKAFGLAGLRVGYALAHAHVVAEISRIADSYNVNRITQAAALAALEAVQYYKARVAEIIKSRDWLRIELLRRGFGVPESRANLLFARHPRASEMYLALKKEGILVRYFESGELSGGIRISIGTREQLERMLSLIDKQLG